MKLGTLLAGRYQIVRPIAKGGMANIFEGRDGKQRVVVKILKESLSKDPEIVARFHREVRSASQLTSKHVVRILGFGTTDEDCPFLVMEYLFGNDLGKELSERKVLPLEEAAAYMAQTCHAMVEAHDAGIVHRDLKPSNLYIARDIGRRVLKVLDFGIAKVTGNTDEEQLTRPSSILGSPQYMAPETFKGAENADVRSDIWSLGIIFYEMLTGQLPFTGDGPGAIAMTVMREAYVPPTEVQPKLPRAADVVIGRALKKNPDERYQTMREFLAAFEVFMPTGRNDTMAMPRVVAPPAAAAAPGAEVKATDLQGEPPTMKEVGPPAPQRPPLAPRAALDPSDPPTRIRPLPTRLGAPPRPPSPPAAPGLRRAPATSLGVVPGDGDGATLVQAVPVALLAHAPAQSPPMPPTPVVDMSASAEETGFSDDISFTEDKEPAGLAIAQATLSNEAAGSTVAPAVPASDAAVAPGAAVAPDAAVAPAVASQQAIPEEIVSEAAAWDAAAWQVPLDGEPAAHGAASHADAPEAAASPSVVPDAAASTAAGFMAAAASPDAAAGSNGPLQAETSGGSVAAHHEEPRPTSSSALLPAELETFPQPKKKIPIAAWLAAAVVLIGISGWWLASGGEPGTASEASARSTADGAPATTAPVRTAAPIVPATEELALVAAEPSAEPAPEPAPEPTASVEVAAVEQPAPPPPARVAPARRPTPAPAVTARKPPKKPTPATTAKRKPAFNPKKI